MKINLKDFFRGRVICHCFILSLLVSNTVFLLLFLRYYTPPLPEVFLKNGKENIPGYTKEASFKDGGKLFLAYNENAVFLELNTPGGSVFFESKKDSFYFFSTFFDSMWQFSNRGYKSYCSSIDNIQFLDLNKDGINDIKITETGKFVRSGANFILCKSIDGKRKIAETADGKKLIWKRNDFTF